MSLPLSRTPASRAADAVFAYLKTRRGERTPFDVRARLLCLDWVSIGAGPVPTETQVHWTRTWLEESELEDARAELAHVRAHLSRAQPANDPIRVFRVSRNHPER